MGAISGAVGTRDEEAEFQLTEEDRQRQNREKWKYAAKSRQKFRWPLLLIVTVTRQCNPATGLSEKPWLNAIFYVDPSAMQSKDGRHNESLIINNESRRPDQIGACGIAQRSGGPILNSVKN